MRAEEPTLRTHIGIRTRPYSCVRNLVHSEPDTLSFRHRAVASSGIALPEGRLGDPQRIGITRHGERDPIRAHDLRESMVVCAWKAGLVGREERGCAAVELGTGGEGELEDGGAVAVAVDAVEGHLVGGTCEEARDQSVSAIQLNVAELLQLMIQSPNHVCR